MKLDGEWIKFDGTNYPEKFGEYYVFVLDCDNEVYLDTEPVLFDDAYDADPNNESTEKLPAKFYTIEEDYDCGELIGYYPCFIDEEGIAYYFSKTVEEMSDEANEHFKKED